MRVMAAGWSKRAVLRAGYGAVIAVLVLSTVEAYRIQVSVSRQHLEIYRHFVEQEEALTTLRRNLWLAGNYVRDFFIQNTPEQGAVLVAQLQKLEQEDERAFRVLRTRAQPPRSGTGAPQEPRRILDHRRNSFRRPCSTPATTPRSHFSKREVVPRRGELYNALREVTAADQRMLENSEGEFAGTRRRAAERLLLMLGLGVLLSVLVTRISLRHADNLEREADRHFAAVEQAKQELQQLSARLLEIEEEGRRRLSRELHDEIGQSLALLQIEISHAQALLAGPHAELRDRLARARELAERIVQSIRNISGLLRPALLDDLGLVPALQFQLEDFLRRSGIALRIHRGRRGRPPARCRQDLRLPRRAGGPAQLREALRRAQSARHRAPARRLPAGGGGGRWPRLCRPTRSAPPVWDCSACANAPPTPEAP